MSTPPYIPFFGADYLRDTQLLSVEEHGAYFLLMLTCWQQDDCSLPDDDRKLARICRVTPREWKKIRPIMLDFWTLKGGRWTNKRLTKERKNADEKSEAARSNARKRWNAQPTEKSQSRSYGGTSEGISSASSSAEQPQPQEEEPKGSPSVERAPKHLRALPEDFEPILTPSAQTDAEFLGPARFEQEVRKFRDHHTAKGTRMKDWQAALRTWLSNAAQWTRERNGSGNQPPRDNRDAFARLVDSELGLGGDGRPARSTG